MAIEAAVLERPCVNPGSDLKEVPWNLMGCAEGEDLISLPALPSADAKSTAALKDAKSGDVEGESEQSLPSLITGLAELPCLDFCR